MVIGTVTVTTNMRIDAGLGIAKKMYIVITLIKYSTTIIFYYNLKQDVGPARYYKL